MKTKYLSTLFIVLATGVVSCKKEQNSVTGRWLETKLILHQDSANVVLWDTTYLSPFTRADYIQFNGNGTCVAGGDFSLSGVEDPWGFPKSVEKITPGTYNFSYSASGAGYIIVPNPLPPVNFSGEVTTDSAYVNGNTLLQRVVNYGFGPGTMLKAVYESYYIRQ